MEDHGLVGGQRPLAHLRVGGGGHVDAPDRRLALEPAAGRDGRQPRGARLERLEEAVHPAPLAPAVRVGRRPGAELLAVVAHHAHPVAGLGGVVAQVVDHGLDRPERDPVAQALLGAEHREQVALVLGGVGAPQGLLGDRGGPEVLVVEDRPAVSGPGQRGRQVWLPHALGQPCPARPAAGQRLQAVRHPGQLVEAVALGQGGQDRLVQAAAEELDLPARHQRAQAFEELRPLGRQPLEQRARVVQRQPDAGVALERLEHRQVGLAVDLREHPAEVADGLVIVDRQRQRDPRGHRFLRWCRATGRARLGPGQSRAGSAPGSSMPAAGRYSRSTYWWSMRVVENFQIVLAIELRISCTKRAGRPSPSRS